MVFCCTHTNSLDYTLPINYQLITTDLPGINIWEKVNYRHCRHIYYIYKNLNLFNYPEIIGIFQKKRYLTTLTIPDGYNCVVPAWGRNSCTVYNQYCICHNKEIIDLSKEIINDYHYDKFLQLPMTGVHYHNMFVLHSKDFMKYCYFLFDVLFKIERRVDEFSDAPFIAERLGAFWFWRYMNKRYISPIVEL